MSISRDIGNSVKVLVDFISDKTKENIVSEYRSGKIDISEKDLRSILSLIESSCSQGFSLGYKEIDETVKVIESST